MAKKFDYTATAYRYTARFPLLTYVGTQINFWIVANILLFVIMRQQSRIVNQAYETPVALGFGRIALTGVILGVLYGVALGLTGYYLDKEVFRKLALGKIILFKTAMSLIVLFLILALLRYVLFDLLISPSLPLGGLAVTDASWQAVNIMLMIYYFAMSFVINFINQINKKYGPGVLLPLLLGRYRVPKEEERIFMFMDLKSSTATAERLGHLRYSSFIRDCFADINEVLYPFRAQVYQYVGDEIVLTWPEDEGLKDHVCIEFYFACKKQFKDRTEYYMENYGFLPDFKAGVHTGIVTTVEIGEVKRDIAYHGDTLNTASRIQSVCNDFGKSFIASKVLVDKLGPNPKMINQALGMILLKGKASKMALESIDWV